MVTVTLARSDDNLLVDVIQMSRDEATALRVEGKRVAEMQGDLQEFDVEPLSVFSLPDWRSVYGDLLTTDI